MTTQTTHSAIETTTHPVERIVTAVLVLAALAGFSWVGSMFYAALTG
ncbi:morphogenic membrane protein MmpA [Streptomyces sp. NPDC000880]